jgi:hypothetical protein
VSQAVVAIAVAAITSGPAAIVALSARREARAAHHSANEASGRAEATRAIVAGDGDGEDLAQMTATLVGEVRHVVERLDGLANIQYSNEQFARAYRSEFRGRFATLTSALIDHIESHREAS